MGRDERRQRQRKVGRRMRAEQRRREVGETDMHTRERTKHAHKEERRPACSCSRPLTSNFATRGATATTTAINLVKHIDRKTKPFHFPYDPQDLAVHTNTESPRPEISRQFFPSLLCRLRCSSRRG